MLQIFRLALYSNNQFRSTSNTPHTTNIHPLPLVLPPVEDVNDNMPVFDRASYHCQLTELPVRGQFVTMVSAHDPDASDQLLYRIADGNDRQLFYMDKRSGA